MCGRAGLGRRSTSHRRTVQPTTPQQSSSAGCPSIPASTSSRTPAIVARATPSVTALLQAAGDIVMFTDADLSSPMEEAERLIAALNDGADVAIGSRWMDRTRQTIHQPLYRQFFGRCFNWVTRTVMGLPFKDTQCGFKAFKRSAAQVIFRLPDHRALGLRSRDSLHRSQAEVHHSRGPGHLGPRRAQPYELPPRWNEDARRHGSHPWKLHGWPL